MEADASSQLLQFATPVDDVIDFALRLDPTRFPDFVGHCKQVVQFTKSEVTSKHWQPSCRLFLDLAFDKPGTGNVHCQLLIYGERGHHRALDLDPDLLQPHTYFLRPAEWHLREAARRRVEAMK